MIASTETEVVVVCLAEIEEVAEIEGYGKVNSPWDKIDFEECGSFDVTEETLHTYLMFHPNDALARSCLKIMEEENETVLFLVYEHTEEIYA